MISTLRDSVDIIFNSYSHVPHGAWKEKTTRDLDTFRKLLSFNPQAGLMKADEFPPLIYAGLVKEEGTIFRHEALIKVCHSTMH